MKQPKRNVTSKGTIGTLRKCKVNHLDDKTIARINEGFSLAYRSESREVERMSSIFLSYGKK